MLHIHVLLVTPLGASHMAQPGTDQHESRIAIRERTNHTGPAADFPVQPFNYIVSADPRSMLIGKSTIWIFLEFQNLLQKILQELKSTKRHLHF